MRFAILATALMFGANGAFAGNIFSVTRTSLTEGTIDLEIGGYVIFSGTIPLVSSNGEEESGAPYSPSWSGGSTDVAAAWQLDFTDLPAWGMLVWNDALFPSDFNVLFMGFNGNGGGGAFAVYVDQTAPPPLGTCVGPTLNIPCPLAANGVATQTPFFYYDLANGYTIHQGITMTTQFTDLAAPTPEPAALTLFLAGLAAIPLCRGRMNYLARGVTGSGQPIKAA